MLKLFDTLSQELVPLVPKGEENVLNIYVCGITPYDNCHLGHARTFSAFDTLRKWVEHGCGHEVNYIQNVTDIDDKIIKRAREKDVKPLELSDEFDRKSREEMERLHIKKPTVMPKISEHIPQTIKMIQKLIDNDTAYVTGSGVYYDISTFENYGMLSGQDLEKIRAGARIEVDEKKRNPEDFALWKLEETQGATYDSPWGRGRPGWHIECSAMSMHHTKGEPLDLHCGARDLIFPHHENEIAQSEGAGYIPFSHMWVHTGFLTVDGEKMAKSLGNFITIEDALKKWDANTLRLFFALTHYRSPVDFSEKSIDSAKSTLDNIKRNLALMYGEGEKSDAEAEDGLKETIQEEIDAYAMAMNKDLDTPSAISHLIAAAKIISSAKAEDRCSKEAMQEQIDKIKAEFEVFGIVLDSEKKSDLSEDEINQMIQKREHARKEKDWAESDRIRDELKKKGVIIEDGSSGVKWRYI